jgi:hypothetical protein
MAVLGTAHVDERDTNYNPGQAPQVVSQSGVLSLTTGDARLRSQPGPGAGYKTMIISDGRAYVSPPQIPAPGKTWTLLVGQSDHRPGFSCTTPQSWLSEAERLSDLRIAGTDQVRGISTTRLTATIKNSAGKALPGVRTIPIELWIDDGQRLRMLRISAWDGNSNDVGFAMTCWYTDFGVPVHVTAPPPRRVDTYPTPSPTPSRP